MTERTDFQKEKDEVSLKELLLQMISAMHYLFSKWKVIVIAMLVGLAGGLAYTLFSTTNYSATINFVTDNNQNSSGGLNPYMGLAATFGLNLGNSGLGNSLFSGNNIYDLMKTRRMLQNTLLTPVEIDGRRTLLVDRYIQMEGLREVWKDDPRLKDIVFDEDPSRYTLYHNQIISSICKTLRKENLQFPGSDNSANSSLMTVTVVSPDEQFSALFATHLVENVGKYYVNTTTQTARNTLNVLDKQLDSVKNQLYGSMSNAALFSDRNINMVKQGPQVQQQKAGIKMKVNSAMYEQLVSAVETAKMALQKQTPLFEIVDRPVLPLDRQRPSIILWPLLGLFLATVLSVMTLLLFRFYRTIVEDSTAMKR